MTIRNRALNERLGNLERCAEMAPTATYERSKDMVAAIHDIADFVLSTLCESGFKAGNDDRLRNLEVALYGYVLESNPDEVELTAGEGFGEHVDGPAGKRVMANAIADRDFLASFNA